MAFIFDRLTAAIARLSGWALFAIGLMLGIEVVARYVFNAPTIWAEELSRVFMVWAVFLAAAGLLPNDGHIRVTAVVDLLGPRGRRMVRLFALASVAAVSAIVVWHGVDDPLKSIERGRTTGTMLDPPAWLLQAAVPMGFALLGLQAALCFLRVALGQKDEPERRIDHRTT